VTAGLVVLLVILICVAHITEGQESFELFKGVSIWPTVLLRLLACGLCVYYIGRTFEALGKRNEKVHDEFPFLDFRGDNSSGGVGGVGDALRNSWLAWTKAPSEKTEVPDLYREFAEHGALWRRTFRFGLLTILTLILFALAWFIFEFCFEFSFEPVGSQARGHIARVCYCVVSGLTFITSTALLMFIVDSTLLSYRFVSALAGRKWPDDQVAATAAERWGLSVYTPEADVRGAVGEWLSIRLIEAVTNVVAGRLIYYPFVVLLVLFVAQNPIFDNWHLNVLWAWIALFYASGTVVCAVFLQIAAKRARSRALGVLDDFLRARPGTLEAAVRKQLTKIRSEIEGVDTGAFAGFSNNPVVRAVLLPLGGGAGLVALDALLNYLARQ
jgi:hypothetical protein